MVSYLMEMSLLLVVSIIVVYVLNKRVIDKNMRVVYNRITFFFGNIIKSIIN